MHEEDYRPIGERKSRLLDALFNVGAVELTGYHKLKLHETNPDAPLSPIFMNLRTPDNPKPGPLTPEIVEMVAKIFYDYVMASKIRFELVVPIPNAADPFVEAFCKMLPDKERRLLKLTKVVEKDGKRHIGPPSEEAIAKIEADKVTLLFDDLITKAGSKLEAIHVLEKFGLQVRDVVVLIDRGQGGREELEEDGYRLHSILLLSEILNYGIATDRIDFAKYVEIKEYLRCN